MPSLFFFMLVGLATAIPLTARQNQCSASGLTVDLGYSVYRGYDAGNGLNAWTNVRYAAPPTGTNRWQKPQPPQTTTSSVIAATAYPTASMCPQVPEAPFTVSSSCGSAKNYTSCGIKMYSEDCLVLNVYAPSNATDLPVLVFIHGGGYGTGSGGQYDMAALVNANQQSFIGVTIQYRLGAFGFLASPTVEKSGILNAGLYDQQFALQWVQDNICQFGGDASRVTIMGQSAGGGSVMAHTLAMNGTLGNSLFSNAIAASPYLPKTYDYSNSVPQDTFNAFATAAGCTKQKTVFKCLQGKGSYALQIAALKVSGAGPYGTWAFTPLVDGVFLAQIPSAQLYSGNVNGERILTSNVAVEGSLFVPQNITSDSDFEAYAAFTYPDLDMDDIVATYPSPDNAAAPLFATDGSDASLFTALNHSSLATQEQARANNFYGEATFVCPSYWLADAFARTASAAYKYQFSIPPATHFYDIYAYFGPLSMAMYNSDFQAATMQMVGNFVVNNDPSISDLYANGISTSDTTPNPASSWPQWTTSTRNMMNLNETNGTPSTKNIKQNHYTVANVPVNVDPTLQNDFRVVDATPWEGGRGARCDFWRSQGANVPA